jgi:hypothetical protein
MMNANNKPGTIRAIPGDIDILLRNTPNVQTRSAIVTRRVATLEREAPRVMSLGRSVNANVNYLGIAPMFNKALMFAGDETDWIIGPIGGTEIPVVPREHKKSLERLESVGAHFPMLYVAHEVKKGSFPGYQNAPSGLVASIPVEQVGEIVGPTPMPAGSIETADRLSLRTNQVFNAMRRLGAGVGAVAATPLLLLSSAVSALSTLDPIVFGVIPALLAETDEPAAWYVLARWDW